VDHRVELARERFEPDVVRADGTDDDRDAVRHLQHNG